MRIAFMVAQLWNMNIGDSEKWVSLTDALAWFDHEMLGKRLNAPEKVTPEQMAMHARGIA